MILMILIEQHQYSRDSEQFKELDHLCFLAKNLYNSTLYQIRKYFFETKKYLSYKKVNKLSYELFPKDYTALPIKVSQQVEKLVDQNFRSFFALLKKKKEHPELDLKVNIPGYLDKVKGRQELTFTNQAVSYNNRNTPKGYVRLSGVSFLIKTEVEKIQFARIVPHNSYITVEIGYEVEEPELISNDRYASIDIGVNNLATVTSNVFKPFIINGKPLKSINQNYNKRISKLASKNSTTLDDWDTWSKLMNLITRKRANKIKDYMHKASKYVVNQLVENHISLLVIGHNNEWKQDTKYMGNVTNQNFIQIPFNYFISMLKYKCRLEGIQVVTQEESYTSKCSFMNQDFIPTYGVNDDLFKPTGYRCKRGLYKNHNTSKDRTFINSDVNGSLNILRKFLTEQVAWNEKIFSDCVEVCSTPTVFTVKT